MMMNDRETPSSAGGRPFFSPDETSPEVSNTLRRRRLEDDEGDDDDDGGGGGDDANTTTEVTDFSSSLTGMMDEEFGTSIQNNIHPKVTLQQHQQQTLRSCTHTCLIVIVIAPTTLHHHLSF